MNIPIDVNAHEDNTYNIVLNVATIVKSFKVVTDKRTKCKDFVNYLTELDQFNLFKHGCRAVYNNNNMANFETSLENENICDGSIIYMVSTLR